jgi:hypothetical protein
VSVGGTGGIWPLDTAFAAGLLLGSNGGRFGAPLCIYHSVESVESVSGGMQRGHVVVRLSKRISFSVALNVGQH